MTVTQLNVHDEPVCKGANFPLSDRLVSLIYAHHRSKSWSDPASFTFAKNLLKFLTSISIIYSRVKAPSVAPKACFSGITYRAISKKITLEIQC